MHYLASSFSPCISSTAELHPAKRARYIIKRVHLFRNKIHSAHQDRTCIFAGIFAHSAH